MRYRPDFEKRNLCKCCSASADFLGAIDFARSCQDLRGRVFPDSGTDVPYYQCQSCGFVFTDFFDDWTTESFRKHVYNDDYKKADPSFAGERPRHNKATLERLLPRDCSLLDFGGGDGSLSDLLIRSGFSHTQSYDPFYGGDMPPSEEAFDAVVAFEVVEHAPHPLDLFERLIRLTDSEGVILFSTLLVPARHRCKPLDWWYVAPRNGHCSIFSGTALAVLAVKLGASYFQIGDGLHILLPGTGRKLGRHGHTLLRRRGWAVLRNAARLGWSRYLSTVVFLLRQGILRPALNPSHVLWLLRDGRRGEPWIVALS